MRQEQYLIHSDAEDRHWWWRARREIVHDTIARYAPKGRPLAVVEVGCGTGGNLAMLSRFGSVLGAEAESAALAELRRKHHDRFPVIAHAIPAPLPRRFDVLAMLDVLEHVKDDRAALEWARSHLEPGGIAVVTVPAFDFLWTEQDEAVHHLRRYTRARLEAALPSGLERVHATYFNSILFPPIATIRAGMRLRSRREGPPRSHLGVPPEPLNHLLYRLFRLERRVVPSRRLPLGVSILLVARRQPDSG